MDGAFGAYRSVIVTLFFIDGAGFALSAICLLWERRQSRGFQAVRNGSQPTTRRGSFAQNGQAFTYSFQMVGNIEADFFASWVSAQVESNSIARVQAIADYAKRSHPAISRSRWPQKAHPLLDCRTLHKNSLRIIGVMRCTA